MGNFGLAGLGPPGPLPRGGPGSFQEIPGNPGKSREIPGNLGKSRDSPLKSIVFFLENNGLTRKNAFFKDRFLRIAFLENNGLTRKNAVFKDRFFREQKQTLFVCHR